MEQNNRIFKSVKKLMTKQQLVLDRKSTGRNSRLVQHKAQQCLCGGTN